MLGVVAQAVSSVLVLQHQRRLPEADMRIKPVRTGGVAGGQKFVVGKVLALAQASPYA
jgi:hypothetical protein